MQSIWTEGVACRVHKPLVGDRETDVLIVGGGMAGILTAYYLKAAGVSCIVAEANEIGSGTSGNTTAKITAQHGLCYAKMIEKHGAEQAALYYAANVGALDRFRTLAKEIACDFEDKTAYIYARASALDLEKELAAYGRLKIPGFMSEKVPLPFVTAGAIGMPHQAQFHPLKFLYEIARDLEIYEHSPIRQLEGNRAYGETGTVTARRIVLATRFPLVNIPGLYFMKLFQDRSYVAALEDGPQVDGIYLDEAEDGFSFRNYGDYLLIGGGGHRTGKRGGCRRSLSAFAEKEYPDCTVRYEWAAQDCMSLDGIPYIGVHRRFAPNVYVATGFNKWGMTGSMVAAGVLTELITKGSSDYEALFCPSRSMVSKQLFVNLGSAAGNLLKFGKPRCSHMGCALKWNAEEKSWDCPCHGSRYDDRGEILDNPAKKEIEP